MATGYENLSDAEVLNQYLINPTPQAAEEYQKRIMSGVKRTVSGGQGVNVMLPTATPAVAQKTAEQIETERILNKQEGPQITPDLSKIPLTMRLGHGSGTRASKISITPGAYSEETGKALGDSFRKQAEAEKVAAGITEAGKPTYKFVGPYADYNKAVESNLPTTTGPLADGSKAFQPIVPDPAENSKLGVLNKHMDTISKWKAANLKEQEKIGWEKDKRIRDNERAEQLLISADERIRNAEIDPNRFYSGGAGFFRAVLGGVASAFGAYAQGLSGGKIPNTAVQIIERAIQRDVEAQKTNLNKLMLERGYAKDTRDFFIERFDKTSNEQKALKLRESELEIARMGLESQSSDVRSNTAKIILELDRKATIAEAAAQPKISRTESKSSTGGSREIINPAFQAAARAAKPAKDEKAEPSVSEKLRGNLTLAQNLNDLKQKFNLTDPSRFEALRKIKDKWAEFQTLQGIALFNWVRSQSGAAFTDQEYKRRKALLDSQTLTGFNGWNTGWGSIRKEAKDNSLRILQQYPNMRKSLLKSDLDALTKDPFKYEESLRSPQKVDYGYGEEKNKSEKYVNPLERK